MQPPSQVTLAARTGLIVRAAILALLAFGAPAIIHGVIRVLLVDDVRRCLAAGNGVGLVRLIDWADVANWTRIEGSPLLALLAAGYLYSDAQRLTRVLSRRIRS